MSLLGRAARKARREVARLGAKRSTEKPWVVARDNPARPRTLPSLRLFAVTGTWNESDVIAATVRNALTQGCERVYLVDNESTDDTVEQAVRAGATLARTFSSEEYDEIQRIQLMQEVTETVSESEGDDHIWWLWLDADEFPHGPGGHTIRSYLEQLDRRFRVVGTRYFDHFPDRKPEYISGFHPLDFQPLCELNARERKCPLRCRSHPLRRWDRGAPPVVAKGGGLHKVTCEVLPLIEPTVPLILHHFPFREEAATRARLEQLCGKNEKETSRNRANDDRVYYGVSGITKRFQNLDALYKQDWAHVMLRRDPQSVDVPVSPRPWTELVPTEHQHVLRWYSSDDLDRARLSASRDRES